MALEELMRPYAAERAVQCEIADDRVTVRGRRPAQVTWVEYPRPNDDPLLDFQHALPGRARGDQRELLLAAIARDAAGITPELSYDDLRNALDSPDLIPATDGLQRAVLADVMRDHYWVKPATTNRSSRPFAFPFHVALPGNYREPWGSSSGSYIMFRSDILLFLSWDGTAIDPEPANKLCELLSERHHLTMLDRLLVDGARKLAGPDAVGEIHAVDLLASQQAAKVERFLQHGAFYQPSHDRFRRDFVSALEMPLPRHDRIEAAILTLSLHLALHYYAVSFLLGEGLDAAMAVADRRALPEGGGLSGQILFRVASSEPRRVRKADPCATSWRELDDKYLISLTPSIVVANLLHEVWRSADPGAPPTADPRKLAEAMAADPDLAATLDVAASAFALIDSARQGADERRLAEVAAVRPGIYALRETVAHSYRRTLHYRSRAVVNQLVKRSFGGSLLRTQGNVQFFELDESFLYLLVKFITQGEELPYARFLDGLAAYGLKPQDPPEEATLADVLERLGMLQRYSDAGEAEYVHHLL